MSVSYHCQPRTHKPIRRILTTAFYPLPTVKSVQTKKTPVQRVIYEAAHHLCRDCPLNKPMRIYQCQREEVIYDLYIERTQTGWKDTVRTHCAKSLENKVLYMIDGLQYAIKEEKEIQPLLPHMAHQLDLMCRLLNL
jgi:hypothetical protein